MLIHILAHTHLYLHSYNSMHSSAYNMCVCTRTYGHICTITLFPHHRRIQILLLVHLASFLLAVTMLLELWQMTIQCFVHPSKYKNLCCGFSRFGSFVRIQKPRLYFSQTEGLSLSLSLCVCVCVCVCVCMLTFSGYWCSSGDDAGFESVCIIYTPVCTCMALM